MGGRALFACASFFAPFCSPCPLRCSAQALGFGFFWALLLPWCTLAWCGGDYALLCMVFFCCCSVVGFSFLFSSGSDDSRGDDTRKRHRQKAKETKPVNREKWKCLKKNEKKTEEEEEQLF